jgi:hypothetical protein
MFFDDGDDSDEERQERENLKKITGTVITILGIPKDASAAGINTLVNEVSETALNNMRDVEVSHVSSVPVFTARNIELLESKENLEDKTLSQPIGRAMATIIHAVTELEEREGNLERERQWTSLTEEEQQALIKKHQRDEREWNKQAAINAEHRRQEELDNAFDIAQKWGNRAGLTNQEVAHGVAYDFHRLHAHPHTVDVETGAVKMYNPAQDYADHYQTHFAEQIQSRTIRAAKALFGE